MRPLQQIIRESDLFRRHPRDLSRISSHTLECGYGAVHLPEWLLFHKAVDSAVPPAANSAIPPAVKSAVFPLLIQPSFLLMFLPLIVYLSTLVLLTRPNGCCSIKLLIRPSPSLSSQSSPCC